MHTQCILLHRSGQMPLQIKPELERGSRRQHNSTFAFLLQDPPDWQSGEWATAIKDAATPNSWHPTLTRSRKGRVQRTDTQREQKERWADYWAPERTHGRSPHISLIPHAAQYRGMQMLTRVTWGSLLNTTTVSSSSPLNTSHKRPTNSRDWTLTLPRSCHLMVR